MNASHIQENKDEGKTKMEYKQKQTNEPNWGTGENTNSRNF